MGYFNLFHAFCTWPVQWMVPLWQDESCQNSAAWRSNPILCCPHNNKKQQTNQWWTKTGKKQLLQPFLTPKTHPKKLRECTVNSRHFVLVDFNFQGHPPTWSNATKSTRVHWSEDDRFLYRGEKKKKAADWPRVDFGGTREMCVCFFIEMWLDVCYWWLFFFWWIFC